MPTIAFAPAVALAATAFSATTTLDGVTFAESEALYAPVRELCSTMHWMLEYDSQNGTLWIEGTELKPDWILRLPSGRTFVAPELLDIPGLEVDKLEDGTLRLRWGSIQCDVKAGLKRIEIDLTRQELVAYQGQWELIRTPISSGKKGYRTPTGTFTAGPGKYRMHYSRLYDNAPMPYSIQVVGNVFLHGYHSVPKYPASHGCIRVPLTGWNPAKWLFDWTEVGTEIRIFYGKD